MCPFVLHACFADTIASSFDIPLLPYGNVPAFHPGVMSTSSKTNHSPSLPKFATKDVGFRFFPLVFTVAPVCSWLVSPLGEHGHAFQEEADFHRRSCVEFASSVRFLESHDCFCHGSFLCEPPRLFSEFQDEADEALRPEPSSPSSKPDGRDCSSFSAADARLPFSVAIRSVAVSVLVPSWLSFFSTADASTSVSSSFDGPLSCLFHHFSADGHMVEE